MAKPALDPIYPVLLIDAIVLKVRDGAVANRPVYVAIDISVDRNANSPRPGTAQRDRTSFHRAGSVLRSSVKRPPSAYERRAQFAAAGPPAPFTAEMMFPGCSTRAAHCDRSRRLRICWPRRAGRLRGAV